MGLGLLNSNTMDSPIIDLLTALYVQFGSESGHAGLMIVKKQIPKKTHRFLEEALKKDEFPLQIVKVAKERTDIPKRTEFPIISMFLANKNAYTVYVMRMLI
jgi:hypothetical protein